MSTNFNAAIQCTNTLMAYDVCQVNNENNKNISVLCQYDGGSTDNFILSSLANSLELSCQNVKLNLTRVGLPENIFHTKEYYLNSILVTLC